VRELSLDLAYPEFYNDDGFVKNMPWLYYETNALSTLQKPNRPKFRTSFGFEDLEIGIVSKMRYKLAKYDIYGNFHGFEDLDS
jgi:meckelin